MESDADLHRTGLLYLADGRFAVSLAQSSRQQSGCRHIRCGCWRSSLYSRIDVRASASFSLGYKTMRQSKPTTDACRASHVAASERADKEECDTLFGLRYEQNERRSILRFLGRNAVSRCSARRADLRELWGAAIRGRRCCGECGKPRQSSTHTPAATKIGNNDLDLFPPYGVTVGTLLSRNLLASEKEQLPWIKRPELRIILCVHGTISGTVTTQALQPYVYHVYRQRN